VLTAGRKIVVSSYVSEREIAASLERSGIPAGHVVRPHAGQHLRHHPHHRSAHRVPQESKPSRS
jgi:hypothetical protein